MKEELKPCQNDQCVNYSKEAVGNINCVDGFNFPCHVYSQLIKKPFEIIIIPGNVCSKKNSRIISRNRSFPSKAYSAWHKQAIQELQFKRVQAWPGEYPVELKIFFWRENKRSFDVENMISSIQDTLTKAGIIEDDSVNHVIPVFTGWGIDKRHPRTIIELVSVDANKYFKGVVDRE